MARKYPYRARVALERRNESRNKKVKRAAKGSGRATKMSGAKSSPRSKTYGTHGGTVKSGKLSRLDKAIGTWRSKKVTDVANKARKAASSAASKVRSYGPNKLQQRKLKKKAKSLWRKFRE